MYNGEQTPASASASASASVMLLSTCVYLGLVLCVLHKRCVSTYCRFRCFDRPRRFPTKRQRVFLRDNPKHQQWHKQAKYLESDVLEIRCVKSLIPFPTRFSRLLGDLGLCNQVLFRQYDTDDSGAIDEREFRQLVKAVNNASPMFPGNFAKALHDFDV